MWRELSDIPLEVPYSGDEFFAESFTLQGISFPVGITRTELWRWFDDRHPRGVALNDDFSIEWATFQKNFVTLIRKAERFLDEAAMRQVWNSIFGILYLCYDLEKEFLSQFRENAEKLLRGLQIITGAKTTYFALNPKTVRIRKGSPTMVMPITKNLENAVKSNIFDMLVCSFEIYCILDKKSCLTI